jgi:O-antigen ligase
MKIGLLAGLLALAAGVVLLATVGNISIFDRFLNQDIATLNGRTYLWQTLLNHFDPAQLLGHGLNASSVLLANLQVGYGAVIATSASNLFVAALYDHGIIGVSLLSLLFIVLGVGLLTGLRKTTGDQRMLFLMALVVFASMALQSFDANDLWAQSIGVYFWVVMALPFALCWSTTRQSSRTHKEVADEVMEPAVEAVPEAKKELVARL